MKLVYIAGPYRAKTINGIHENIERARKVALKYWKMGYAVICPHMNSALIDGHISDEHILEADRLILRMCDAIVMMKNWRKSEGATHERAVAMNNNLEVIYD